MIILYYHAHTFHSTLLLLIHRKTQSQKVKATPKLHQHIFYQIIVRSLILLLVAILYLTAPSYGQTVVHQI